MAEAVAVTNTSPVIALASIGQLRLFDVLFDRIVVPLAVWGELTDKPGHQNLVNFWVFVTLHSSRHNRFHPKPKTSILASDTPLQLLSRYLEHGYSLMSVTRAGSLRARNCS